MQTIRHLALQRELTRIESTAQAHTLAIINRSADLESAYDLCLTVSVGLPEAEAFTPTVTYDDDEGTCDINVFTFERGHDFLRRLDGAGLAWSQSGHGFGAIREIAIDRYPRVHVLVVDSELDEYQRRAWRAKTAAAA